MQLAGELIEHRGNSMCKGPEEVSSMVVNLLSLEIFILSYIQQVFWAPALWP